MDRKFDLEDRLIFNDDGDQNIGGRYDEDGSIIYPDLHKASLDGVIPLQALYELKDRAVGYLIKQSSIDAIVSFLRTSFYWKYGLARGQLVSAHTLIYAIQSRKANVVLYLIKYALRGWNVTNVDTAALVRVATEFAKVRDTVGYDQIATLLETLFATFQATDALIELYVSGGVPEAEEYFIGTEELLELDDETDMPVSNPFTRGINYMCSTAQEPGRMCKFLQAVSSGRLRVGLLGASLMVMSIARFFYWTSDRPISAKQQHIGNEIWKGVLPAFVRTVEQRDSKREQEDEDALRRLETQRQFFSARVGDLAFVPQVLDELKQGELGGATMKLFDQRTADQTAISSGFNRVLWFALAYHTFPIATFFITAFPEKWKDVGHDMYRQILVTSRTSAPEWQRFVMAGFEASNPPRSDWGPEGFQDAAIDYCGRVDVKQYEFNLPLINAVLSYRQTAVHLVRRYGYLHVQKLFRDGSKSLGFIAVKCMPIAKRIAVARTQVRLTDEDYRTLGTTQKFLDFVDEYDIPNPNTATSVKHAVKELLDFVDVLSGSISADAIGQILAHM
jgi:hypothetical protein